MKIHEILLDVDHYQSLFLAKTEILDTDLLRFDCRPRFDTWVPPSVYSLHPNLKAGDFWALETGGAFATTPEATEKLQDFLNSAGELLPLPYEGRLLTVLNVTECLNCLDHDRTKWVYAKSTGKRIRIESYAFHADRMSESSIFKIPERAVSQILCYEGLKDPEDEFKRYVETEGLTGITFTELWRSE